MSGLASLVWNLAALAVWITALLRVGGTPTQRFEYGRWSKAGRLLLAATASVTLGHLFIPLGALVMLLAVRRDGSGQSPLDLAEPGGPRLP